MIKNNIVAFLIKVFLVAGPAIAGIVFFSGSGFLPLITDSIGFDAKLYEIQKGKIQNVELLSIGSSMTFNNLNSDVIKENFELSYYNAGIWGMQISHDRYLSNYYIEKFKPRYVIVCSSIPDFEKIDNFDPPAYFDLYISDHFMDYFYFRNFNPKALRKRNDMYVDFKKDNSDYTSLRFDSFGGVSLNMSKENISVARWNEEIKFPTRHTEFHYKELGRLADIFKEKNIEFIFIQTPIKESALKESSTKKAVSSHFIRSQLIVERHGGHYFNLHNPQIFTDSLFVDQFHLSEPGSRVFTKQVANTLKKIIVK